MKCSRHTRYAGVWVSDETAMAMSPLLHRK